ncbi:MAG TPA: Ig domain-containing protein, partial [Terriglobia bacterium]|nr:Ig domain-containing protein [Terriglobia bacterium]
MAEFHHHSMKAFRPWPRADVKQTSGKPGYTQSPEGYVTVVGKAHILMKKLALVLSILVSMCSCSRPPSPLVVVSVFPNMPPSIDEGQTLQFTASLASNTPGNATGGVTWTATGPGCAGAACGTFTNVTSNSATYVAPASVTANLGVTVIATSVLQPLQTGSSTFTVMLPPSITTTSLPVATPNYVYHVYLQASGGVQPLNWSLASGTLPAGMIINTAGVIFGTPTTGGTSTFTVKVTDSSGSPAGTLSKQQTFSLTVAGILSVTAGVLPAGTVGIAYSTALPSTGGLPPLAWSIYSGSLPAGLVLQNTGVISGTPTVAGTYSFQVYVVDSSPVQQNYTSTNFTITINPSGPLTIRTSALVDGTVGTSYQGQLVATGGSPPLVWTITAGALPAGLALNPATGAITGTPTASPGAYPFTMEVQDTSSPPETSTQQLSITINATAPACSSSGTNTLLDGQYAFNLRGFNGVGFLTVVGSFTTDGAGDITAGEADTNGVLGPQYGNLIISASSYSVGPDHRGCATLATPFGTFYTRFALGALTEGVATQGRMIEFENPGSSAYIAAGQILQQNPVAFIYPLTNSYDLQTAGWDLTTSGRVACVGIVSGAKNKFSYLQQDCNDNGTVTNTVNTSIPNTTLVNTYTAADQNGRGTGIISVGQGTSYFTFYWVTSTQLLVINSDPSPTFSGRWQQEQVPQGSSSFNNTSFHGNVAFYASGLGAGPAGDVSIATESADGVNSVTSNLYTDVAGAWQTTSTTCTYTVVAIGRVTLDGANCGATPPVSYMNAMNSAFVLGTNPAVELGSFEPQSAGLSNASLAGTYYVGTSEIVSQDAQAEVGILTLTPNGILTST